MYPNNDELINGIDKYSIISPTSRNIHEETRASRKVL